jgi:rod shape determining protein RodA
MLRFITSTFRSIDWLLVGAVLPICVFGLITMHAFGDSAAGDPFFVRQTAWLCISLVAFFVISGFEYRFLRRTAVVVTIFVVICVLLTLLFAMGQVFSGAQSWFDLGLFAFQPVEVAKIALIIVLAKYFSRRHVEIARIRHVFISGLYAFIIFALVYFQPDFGSALIVLAIWAGMVFVSGISKKHLFGLLLLGATAFAGLWLYVLQDYQKARIINFLDPAADIHGTGYNAYQAMITVGSGEVLGKGVGFGTQSRLRFLPEYQTDFVFAAFAEEWGFVGVLILFLLFGIVIWRIIEAARYGETNFETLFALGLAILFMSHFIVHVGMNIGIMPVTGLTFPFMSYGGTHLLVSFSALGLLMGMRRYARAHKDLVSRDLIA